MDFEKEKENRMFKVKILRTGKFIRTKGIYSSYGIGAKYFKSLEYVRNYLRLHHISESDVEIIEVGKQE